MSKPSLISKKTLVQFREHFVGWTLREISEEFDAEDIGCDLSYEPGVGGQRRTLVEQYYHTLDFSKWSDVKKLLAVFESALGDLEDDIADSAFEYMREDLEKTHRLLLKLLSKDGFEWKADKLVATGHLPTTQELESVANVLDAPYLRTQIDRIRDHIEKDPRLAIGTAKELVETACKTVLKEAGKPVTGKPNVLELVTTVCKELDLVPDSVPDAAKASQTIKTLLRTLATIVQGVAELRRGYGSGHGPDGKPRGLQARHARLASGAAATLATFLIETHHERETTKKKK